MERFFIRGQQELSGDIPVYGAKNHALKMIPATFLSEGSVTLRNVPGIDDVAQSLELVVALGGDVERIDASTVKITAPTESAGIFPQDIASKLRASIVFLGPVLARYHTVVMPHPGGCNLGKRPIDLFIRAFELMGASITTVGEHMHFSAPQGLNGAHIVFPVITVTGTETVLMAACLAKGETVIENASVEPEIIELTQYLIDHGAQITGIGTHVLRIIGGGLLTGGSARILPDRIEAGSFVMLAAAARAHIRVINCRPDHLTVPLEILRAMGLPMTITEDTIEVHPHQGLQAHSIVTHEYPGFPTDLQAPMTVLLTQASGTSMVRETIYDGRLFYTDTLNTMGAKITLMDSYRAVVEGATELHGKLVVSPDLRAGIAMVIAGLIAKGTTTIEHINHIDRGYERIEQRLQAIHADITRIE